MLEKSKVSALIVAAGSGSRYVSTTPKQYEKLRGKTVLSMVIQTFMNHPQIDEVWVVIGQGHAELFAQNFNDLSVKTVQGGATRQDSVRLGLSAMQHSSTDFVLVHDAARALVDAELISRVINQLQLGAAAVIPALPVVDSLKNTKDNILTNNLPREGVVAAQTPQGFIFAELLSAHQQASAGHNDDASLMEELGIKVHWVMGSRANMKLTTPEDKKFMENILNSWETRVGNGFDVHRLVAFADDVLPVDKFIMLGGVKIPHTHYLEGHSDADVVLHAVVDAILGTIAAGDIGQHFPPSDASLKGMDSALFVAKALEMLKNNGGEIVNLDVTIIGEKPKISPYAAQIKNRLAEILECSAGRINIKATTTERLGFTGRGEGLAAQAIIACKF